jgi:small subunit ribosomal protein S6
MRRYEILLILPPEADDRVIGGATDRVSQVIGERGGHITSADRWGKRRLAYEIDRQSEGFYLVIDCQADPESMKEIDRVLTLADEVIRFKVVVREAAPALANDRPAATAEAPLETSSPSAGHRPEDG